MIEVSVTGDRELLAGLDRAASRSLGETRDIITKGAHNIKTDWAQRWSGLSHAPVVGRAVSYDVYALPGSIRAEIGPDKSRRQGALGSIIEFGTVHNAPRPGGLPALAAEEPRLERSLADMAERLLAGG